MRVTDWQPVQPQGKSVVKLSGKASGLQAPKGARNTFPRLILAAIPPLREPKENVLPNQTRRKFAHFLVIAVHSPNSQLQAASQVHSLQIHPRSIYGKPFTMP